MTKKCCVCSEEANLIRKGLCPKHYERYLKQRKKLPKHLWGIYDAELEAAGMLVLKKEDDDEFGEIARKLMQQHAPHQMPLPEASAEDAEEEAD